MADDRGRVEIELKLTNQVSQTLKNIVGSANTQVQRVNAIAGAGAVGVSKVSQEVDTVGRKVKLSSLTLDLIGDAVGLLSGPLGIAVTFISTVKTLDDLVVSSAAYTIKLSKLASNAGISLEDWTRFTQAAQRAGEGPDDAAATVGRVFAVLQEMRVWREHSPLYKALNISGLVELDRSIMWKTKIGDLSGALEDILRTAETKGPGMRQIIASAVHATPGQLEGIRENLPKHMHENVSSLNRAKKTMSDSVDRATTMHNLWAGITETILDRAEQVRREGSRAGPQPMRVPEGTLLSAAILKKAYDILMGNEPKAGPKPTLDPNDPENLKQRATGGWVGEHGRERILVGEKGREIIIPGDRLTKVVSQIASHQVRRYRSRHRPAARARSTGNAAPPVIKESEHSAAEKRLANLEQTEKDTLVEVRTILQRIERRDDTGGGLLGAGRGGGGGGAGAGGGRGGGAGDRGGGAAEMGPESVGALKGTVMGFGVEPYGPPGLAGQKIFDPVSATSLGGGLGSYSHRFGANAHEGVDLMAPVGSPTYSPMDGRVARVGGDGWGQTAIVIEHLGPDGKPNGVYSRFLHQHSANVHQNDIVKGGAQIGTSGFANAAHTHFEMWHGPPGRHGSALINPRAVYGWGNKNLPKGGQERTALGAEPSQTTAAPTPSAAPPPPPPPAVPSPEPKPTEPPPRVTRGPATAPAATPGVYTPGVVGTPKVGPADTIMVPPQSGGPLKVQGGLPATEHAAPVQAAPAPAPAPAPARGGEAGTFLFMRGQWRGAEAEARIQASAKEIAEARGLKFEVLDVDGYQVTKQTEAARARIARGDVKVAYGFSAGAYTARRIEGDFPKTEFVKIGANVPGAINYARTRHLEQVPHHAEEMKAAKAKIKVDVSQKDKPKEEDLKPVSISGPRPMAIPSNHQPQPSWGG